MKRPFALRQWLASEGFREQVAKIKAEMEAGSVNKFNLTIRLDSALGLLVERDELQLYALDLERRLRAERRAAQRR